MPAPIGARRPLALGAPAAPDSRPPVTPAGFAFLRTVPGTVMRNPPDTLVIAPALTPQGIGP